MTIIRTRIRVGPRGALSGRARGLPAGEHQAEIILLDEGPRESGLGAEDLLSRIHAIQAEVAHLPILDARSPEKIIGYNEHGHFD